MKIMKTLALLSFVIISSGIVYAQDGESVFKSNCAACHTVGRGKLVGPDLAGIDSRRSEMWLVKWIKSSQQLVKSGDKDAADVFEQNNKIVMPDMSLSEGEIKSLLAYVKQAGSASAAVPAPAPKEAVNTTIAASAGQDSSSSFSSPGGMEYFLIALVCILFFVILGLSRVVKTLSAELAKVSQGK